MDTLFSFALLKPLLQLFNAYFLAGVQFPFISPFFMQAIISFGFFLQLGYTVSLIPVPCSHSSSSFSSFSCSYKGSPQPITRLRHTPAYCYPQNQHVHKSLSFLTSFSSYEFPISLPHARLLRLHLFSLASSPFKYPVFSLFFFFNLSRLLYHQPVPWSHILQTYALYYHNPVDRLLIPLTHYWPDFPSLLLFFPS